MTERAPTDTELLAEARQVIARLGGELDTAKIALAQIAGWHHPGNRGDWCAVCRTEWPCTTRQLAEEGTNRGGETVDDG